MLFFIIAYLAKKYDDVNTSIFYRRPGQVQTISYQHSIKSLPTHVRRFFEILRYQKGIVVELLDRKTGEVEKMESKKNIPEEYPPSSSSIEEDNQNSVVLSDVELYRIYFELL